MTTAVAVILLAAFVVIEGRLRRGAQARSLDAGTADRGTTRLIGAAFGASILGILASPLLNALGIGRLAEDTGWYGVGLMLVGIGVRVWAARSLGASYTRTLRTAPGQRLVQKGLYRLIRHPGYAADIVMWLGAGLATTNFVVLAAVLLAIAIAYRARIAAEEAMLLDAFGDEYRAYQRRTWRLVPLFY